MGITRDGVQQLESAMLASGIDYPGLRMCELGNQYLFPDAIGYRHVIAKAWFESRGVTHVSLDANGEDGAIVCDLSRPLVIAAPFDIVTDFGTSEHVSDWYACLKNCHELCRIGGLMIHVNPESGSWPKHGIHYISEPIMWRVADLCGYEIQTLERRPALGNTVNGWQIHATFKKLTDSFPSQLPQPLTA